VPSDVEMLVIQISTRYCPKSMCQDKKDRAFRLQPMFQEPFLLLIKLTLLSPCSYNFSPILGQKSYIRLHPDLSGHFKNEKNNNSVTFGACHLI